VKKSQENQPGITIDTPAIKSANDTINVEKNNDKHTTTQSLNKQLTTGNKKSTNRIEPGTDRSTIIPEETFIGDWQLVNVEPKAESTKGYLKITASDDNRVVVKSYVQFYYPKNNQAAFPTVFNAFAGCSSCVLSKDIKLQAEDVAIGSQVYKILDQDEKGGKAGDTIAQTGSNKSIHATVTLQLINNTTALIKVQRPTAVSLSDELTLEPFVYVFKFSKAD
jgi:hypothetical protein